MIRIGTRGSVLALAQAQSVARALETASEGAVQTELVPITTSGDRAGPGDKSRFVKEIEEALLRGDVDLAVHSAKDVPGDLPTGLEIVATPAAEDARDAIVGDVRSLEELSDGARIGTSSLRRRSQLLATRPDAEVLELRGNVDTRLKKLAGGDYDAIVIALAGLRRLGREGEASAILGVDDFVPAAGQGILALEARGDDSETAAAARRIGDASTKARLEAERALVEALDASCHTPVGAHARIEGGAIRIDAFVGLPDGREWIRDRATGDGAEPAAVGRSLARRMLAAGAEDLLRRVVAERSG